MHSSGRTSSTVAMNPRDFNSLLKAFFDPLEVRVEVESATILESEFELYYATSGSRNAAAVDWL
jgi:hypothetical protein